MPRPISLAHLTALDLAPPQLIRLAARAGYDAVGLRLIAVNDTTPGYPLMSDRAMKRETQTALSETGIRVADIEFVKIEPETDVAALEAFLAAGAELGAAHVITSPYDDEHGRLADRLGELDELATQYDLGTVLEFFPWTGVPDLVTALSVVRAAGPRIGVLVDSLHFDRSGGRIEDLLKTPLERLPFAHICDAPVASSYSHEELLHTAREARLPPGEGQIDLTAFLNALPPDVPLGVEVPMLDRMRRDGAEAILKASLTATRTVIATAETTVQSSAFAREKAHPSR